MTNPAIGAFVNGDLAGLDVEKLTGTHMCIQGNSGAGKSGALRKLLEITHGRLQHIILDVEDEFYTLREKHEYMIAGGENGDCAATVNNAAALALMILETGFSAIIQLNDLHIDDRREFIASFLDALIGAPKALWHPALVILDEAQMYAPQVGNVSSSSAVVALMTLGRKRGFTGVLAAPRIAGIDKDAIGAVNNWLMGRIGQPADRKSSADALGFGSNSAEARGLIELETGQFWAFGPALCRSPALLQIGRAETTYIRAGMAAVPTPPAPAAMKRMLEKMNKAAQAAEAVVIKPQAMGKTDQALTVTHLSPDHVRIDGGMFDKLKAAKAEGDAEGYARGLDQGRRNATADLLHRIRAFKSGFDTEFHEQFDDVGDFCGVWPPPDAERCDAESLKMIGDMKALQGNGGVIKPHPNTKPAKPAKVRADGELSGAAVQLLNAFSRYVERGLTWDEACIVAGIKGGNGHFYTAKKALVDGGFVEGSGELQYMTISGEQRVGRREPAKRRDIVTLWAAKVGKPGAGMLEYLASIRGPITTEQLAGALNAKPGNGHWYGGISKIREAGLIVQNGGMFELSAFMKETK